MRYSIMTMPIILFILIASQATATTYEDTTVTISGNVNFTDDWYIINSTITIDGKIDGQGHNLTIINSTLIMQDNKDTITFPGGAIQIINSTIRYKNDNKEIKKITFDGHISQLDLTIINSTIRAKDMTLEAIHDLVIIGSNISVTNAIQLIADPISNKPAILGQHMIYNNIITAIDTSPAGGEIIILEKCTLGYLYIYDWGTVQLSNCTLTDGLEVYKGRAEIYKSLYIQIYNITGGIQDNTTLWIDDGDIRQYTSDDKGNITGYVYTEAITPYLTEVTPISIYGDAGNGVIMSWPDYSSPSESLIIYITDTGLYIPYNDTADNDTADNDTADNDTADNDTSGTTGTNSELISEFPIILANMIFSGVGILLIMGVVIIYYLIRLVNRRRRT